MSYLVKICADCENPAMMSEGESLCTPCAYAPHCIKCNQKLGFGYDPETSLNKHDCPNKHLPDPPPFVYEEPEFPIPTGTSYKEQKI